jgi:hypothetical protein
MTGIFSSCERYLYTYQNYHTNISTRLMKQTTERIRDVDIWSRRECFQEHTLPAQVKLLLLLLSVDFYAGQYNPADLSNKCRLMPTNSALTFLTLSRRFILLDLASVELLQQ